jgi:predicted XRE-type DNA-binding protein
MRTTATATAPQTVRVTAKRWQHGWELYGDDGEILTQATTLADAAGEVRDYLGTEHGGEPGDYQVCVTADLGGVEDDVRETAERMAEVQKESIELAEHWRALAAQLRAAGLSVRDAATVMGVSPGRVSQLIKAESPPATRQKRTRDGKWEVRES